MIRMILGRNAFFNLNKITKKCNIHIFRKSQGPIVTWENAKQPQ